MLGKESGYEISVSQMQCDAADKDEKRFMLLTPGITISNSEMGQTIFALQLTSTLGFLQEIYTSVHKV